MTGMALAPGQPKVGSAAHKDWIAYCKKHGLQRSRNPPVYDPKRHPEVARRFVALGATDFEIAQAFNVTPHTIMIWKSKHPEFAEAMRYRDSDGVMQDERVKRSLLHRATGYSYHSEKIFMEDGEVVRVPTIEHVPPSDSAMKFWLTNRDPTNWNVAKDVNINSSASVDVTITKDMSPVEAMGEFMKLLRAPSGSLPPSAPLVIEHDAGEAAPAPAELPVGDASD
jgi:hypothetical protein